MATIRTICKQESEVSVELPKCFMSDLSQSICSGRHSALGKWWKHVKTIFEGSDLESFYLQQSCRQVMAPRKFTGDADISLQSATGQWSGPRKGMAQWKSVCTLAPHCLDIIGLTFSCSLQKSQLCNLSEQQECRSQRWETRATCQKNGSGMFWSIWFYAPSGSFAPVGVILMWPF